MIREVYPGSGLFIMLKAASCIRIREVKNDQEKKN
jgi:hypothetical protein